MNVGLLLKALGVWLAILPCAILNGALRENVLIPFVGSFGGLISSSLILSTCIFLLALLAAPWYGHLSSTQLMLLGLFWLTLTLIFEFGFGRFVQHHTWPELLEAYTFTGGNIWPLVVLVTGVSPWVAARVRGLV